MNFSVKKAKFFSSWHYSENGFEEILSQLLENPPEMSVSAGLLNESSGKMVWRLKAANSAGQEYDFAYKINPRKTPWRYIFKPSLAAREAHNYTMFRELGLPVANVLAVGDKRSFFLLQSSFIATSFLKGTFDGRVFMPLGEMRSETELRRKYSMRNFELLAEIHDNGIFHKAFHPRNMLWRNDNKTFEVFLIDVARCRKVNAGKMKRAVLVDIHTFARDMKTSETELDELLKHYLSCRRNGTYPGGFDALKRDLFGFKRRLFSKKRYVICS